MILRVIIGVVISLFMVGCFSSSVSSDIAQAENEVNIYHVRLNTMDFEKIYSTLDDDVKKKITEKDFVEYLSKFKKSFGKYNNGKIINETTIDGIIGGRKIVILNYSWYEKGEIKEEFTFKKLDDRKLVVINYKYGT